MPPIAVSVAVVDRLLGPRLVPLSLPVGCGGVRVGLVPPRQQRIPLGIPPAQPLLSLILITAEPQAQLYSYEFDRLVKETILQNKSLSSRD
jgi:hypothetical protein